MTTRRNCQCKCLWVGRQLVGISNQVSFQRILNVEVSLIHASMLPVLWQILLPDSERTASLMVLAGCCHQLNRRGPNLAPPTGKDGPARTTATPT